jgi:hypothetical protein
MAIETVALKRIGRSPEARVRWLLKFAARDVTRLSPVAQKAAWDALFAAQSGQSVRVPMKATALAETHQELRACIDAFANGRRYDLYVPGMTWTLRPPARRPAGARQSAPITRESVEAQIMSSAMPAMVTFMLADDLNAIGADRLRACPLETDGQRCGKVFLARKGQRYCTRQHTTAAAWQAYIARGGDIERKLGRK